MKRSTVLIFLPLAIGLLILAKFRRDAASAPPGPQGVSPGNSSRNALNRGALGDIQAKLS